MDWADVLDTVRDLAYNQKYVLSKADLPAPAQLPDRFEPSTLSLKKGAKQVYREDTPRDSIQIREYADRYELEKDKYHPGYHPVSHVVHDATGYLAATVIGGYFAVRMLRRIRQRL